jgi:hypothetical protein
MSQCFFTDQATRIRFGIGLKDDEELKLLRGTDELIQKYVNIK